MSITLRPYQHKFIFDIRECIKKFKHVLASCATGGGKSKCFISIAKGCIEKGKTTLIITESTSIYKQIHQEIKDTVNIGDGVKEFYLHPNKIYVAMAQTLAKRPGLIKQLQDLNDKLLIINDEAHVSTANKVLLQLRDAYLIGVTATPNFDDAPHLPKIYDSIVVGPQAQELVELGWLSPYFHYERKIVDLSKLKKSQKGDYSEESQMIAFDKKEVFDNIVEDLKKFEFYKGMIFCSSIKHCKDIVEKLRILNYNVSECHSKNPNTDYELFQFTHGINELCVSVGSLTKGFNFDPIDFIILNRCTNSLSLYHQMTGRGSRISPPTGKKRFTIIDYGRHATRHKPWNYEHDWENMWNKKQKKEGVAPIKICKKCGFMMHVNVNPCPECGEITIHVPDEKEVKATELVEITSKYNELRGRAISTLNVNELYNYVQMTNKKAFGTRIARSKGLSFLSAYASLNKWKYGWYNNIKEDIKLEFTDIIIR